jgi:hypothetical protein
MSSGTSYGGGGLGDILGDFSGIEKHASHHAGDSADRGIFSSALSMIQQNSGQLQNESVDEDHAVKAHKKYYGGKHHGGGGGSSDGGEATSSGMGAAAAMQALKMFNSGGSSGGSSGGGSQEFMGMAMGQASKLFGEWFRFDMKLGWWLMCLRCRAATGFRQCVLGRVKGGRGAGGGTDGFEDVYAVRDGRELWWRRVDEFGV